VVTFNREHEDYPREWDDDDEFELTFTLRDLMFWAGLALGIGIFIGLAIAGVNHAS